MKEMLFVKNNKVFFFFLSILFSFFLGIRFPHSVHAQIPSPTPVPCDETRDAEFHSLRAYQASPCNSNEDELALYCANDILLTDRFSITDETSTTTDITEGTSGFNKTCTDLPEEGIILCTTACNASQS
jgi:hypothetical protein